MILYFANRKMEIVGSVSTKLPEGFRLLDDNKIEDVETGTTSFECVIGYNKETRAKVEAMTQAGNYLLRSCNNENEFYTVIDFENDRKHQEIRIYAEDAGLDLLNEVVGAYKATEAHTAEWYVNKYISDSGFEIGINEIPSSSTRELSWEGESTCTARIASIATQFGGFEVSYSFEIKGLQVKKKYINLYQKRGKETGCQLRLNRDIENIITTQSIADLATAFVCTGGTPENSETPITLKGYSYDDGDFYVGSDGVLRSRNAVKKWSRYVWNNEPNQQANAAGHIWKPYSYDTLSQQTLCSHAITELKKVCDVAVNYEVEISKLPDNIKIGDRINVIDAAGELYLSTRILQLEYSETQNKHKATLGEYLIRNDGINSKVEELAAQFAKSREQTNKALAESNIAQVIATEAKKVASDAQEEIQSTQKSIDIVKTTANESQLKVSVAETMIQGLSNCVATLITDGNGTSLMTPTDTGWTFSTAEIQNAVNNTSEALNNVMNELGSTEATINVLQQAISDIGEKTDYVNITNYTYTDEHGTEKTEPCIELGESDSVYKLLITNTQILFKAGTNTPTRIETDGLVTENITVEEELRVTNPAIDNSYIWSMDSNGFIGLQWKGADE